MKAVLLHRAFVFLLVLSAFSAERATAQQQTSSIDLARSIKTQWRERYNRIKSLTFTLRTTETINRGYFSSRPGLPSQPGMPRPGEVLPPNDTKFTTTTKYAFDGEKVRVEFIGKRYHGDERRFFEYHDTKVFDGKVTRHLLESKRNEVRLQGTIHPEKRIIVNVLDMLPLANWLGPLWGSEVEFHIANEQVTQAEQRDPNALLEVTDLKLTKMWLDPLRDYMVARAESGLPIPGRNWQIEVMLDAHEDGSWIPFRWKTTLEFGTGKTMVCDLIDVKINPAIPAEAFEVTFPPGTLVMDLRGREKRRYRIKPDGSEEPIPDRRLSRPL